MDKERTLNRIDPIIDILNDFTKTGKIGKTNQPRLKRILEQWKKCSKLSAPVADYGLSPEKIYGWDEKDTPSEDSKKSKIKSLARLMSRLEDDLIEFNEYRKRQGLYFHIEFHIKSCGTGGKYRLQILSYKLDVAELLRTFWHTEQSRQISTHSYTQLDSGKVILQKSPLEEKYGIAEFFREEGPVYIDIEKEYIHYREEAFELHSLLWAKHIVLLKGDASSGKSVISRLIAYDWIKKSMPVRFLYLVQYRDQFPSKIILEEIKNFYQESENALLIIEDAHHNSDALNRLLLENQEHFPKTIISARNTIHENLKYAPIDYFKSLGTIDLNKRDNPSQIITNYFNKQNWDLKEKDILNLKNISGKDLWLLAISLKSLKDNDTEKLTFEKILVEFERALKRKIRRIFEDGKQFLAIKLLIALAVLYRYELETDVYWLQERFISKNYNQDEVFGVLEKLCEIGKITRSKSGRFYGLHHSAYANIYYELGQDNNMSWIDDTLYGNKESFYCDYITSAKTQNGFNLFSKLYVRLHPYPDQFFSKDMINNIFNSDSFIQKFKSLRNVNQINEVLTVARHCDITVRMEFIKKVGYEITLSTILDSDDLYHVGYGIRSLCESFPEFIQKPDHLNDFWTILEKKELCKKIDASEDIYHIGTFINNIFRGSQEIGKKIWGHVCKELLIKKINNEKSPQKIASCLFNIFELNKSAEKNFCMHIKIKPLAEKINQLNDDVIKITDSLRGIGLVSKDTFIKIIMEIGEENIAKKIKQTPITSMFILNFLSLIYSVSDNVFFRVWKPIEKQKFADKILLDTEDLPFILFESSYLSPLYRMHPDIGDEIWNCMNSTNQLQKRIIQKHTFSDYSTIINYTFKHSNLVTYTVWNFLDKEKLLTFFKSESLSSINDFVGKVSNSYPKAANQLLLNINMKMIAAKILETDNLSEIRAFLFRLSELESLHKIKELWGETNQNDLINKINQSNDIFNIIVILSSISDLEKQDSWNLLAEEKLFHLIESEPFSNINSFVDKLSKKFPEIAKNLLLMIDMKIIATKILETDNLNEVREFLFRLSELKSSEKMKELWNELNDVEFINKINQSNDLSSICVIISFVSKALPVEGEIFWDKVKVTLSDKILESKNLFDCGHCINSLFKASEQIGEQLLKCFVKNNQIEKLHDQVQTQVNSENADWFANMTVFEKTLNHLNKFIANSS